MTQPMGTKGSMKMTASVVHLIRALHKARNFAPVQIGEHLGVPRATVFDIVHRRTWSNLPELEPEQVPGFEAAMVGMATMLVSGKKKRKSPTPRVKAVAVEAVEPVEMASEQVTQVEAVVTPEPEPALTPVAEAAPLPVAPTPTKVAPLTPEDDMFLMRALHKVHGMTAEEISEQLDVPLGTVRDILNRHVGHTLPTGLPSWEGVYDRHPKAPKESGCGMLHPDHDEVWCMRGNRHLGRHMWIEEWRTATESTAWLALEMRALMDEVNPPKETLWPAITSVGPAFGKSKQLQTLAG